ncbi:hypothetical protein CBM2634_B120103 [Cupriavidus taiwanensis]|uniref:Uncharacterized protein n=1 Tax=Cupriavidus taiwanensis TaxID=164546 RepID=A0A375J7F3_9BURK|nr:hypothetical protein CBM2634_B120103 [Cupriavidus taiwanensis]
MEDIRGEEGIRWLYLFLKKQIHKHPSLERNREDRFEKAFDGWRRYSAVPTR